MVAGMTAALKIDADVTHLVGARWVARNRLVAYNSDISKAVSFYRELPAVIGAVTRHGIS